MSFAFHILSVGHQSTLSLSSTLSFAAYLLVTMVCTRPMSFAWRWANKAARLRDSGIAVYLELRVGREGDVKARCKR